MIPSSVPHQLFERRPALSWMPAFDDGLARLVRLTISTSAPSRAEFRIAMSKRRHAGDVPDMGAADIDRHLLQHFLEVKGGHEILRRCEEELAFDQIGAVTPVSLSVEETRNAAQSSSKEDARQEDADQHADRQIVGEDHPGHVASMTIGTSADGPFKFLIDDQEKVPIDTMIITATSAAIGIRLTRSPRTGS